MVRTPALVLAMMILLDKHLSNVLNSFFLIGTLAPSESFKVVSTQSTATVKAACSAEDLLTKQNAAAPLLALAAPAHTPSKFIAGCARNSVDRALVVQQGLRWGEWVSVKAASLTAVCQVLYRCQA